MESSTLQILVVDDEPDIVSLVEYHLSKVGFDVRTAASAEDALRIVESTPPGLIVLDHMLPGMSGLELLRRIRESGQPVRDIAVLLLTARREEADRIRGLSTGADDYLTKPFSPEELVLRVKAILRRVSPRGGSADSLTIGEIVIDRLSHSVSVSDQRIELTPTEYKLLSLLAEKRGRVQARSTLLESIWSAAPDIQTRTVDMHIQRLRGKLGEAGEVIETVRGFGYIIAADTDGSGEARS
jgi:two-component system, OmpR family, phosphate regulon response regulator PhoB